MTETTRNPCAGQLSRQRNTPKIPDSRIKSRPCSISAEREAIANPTTSIPPTLPKPQASYTPTLTSQSQVIHLLVPRPQARQVVMLGKVKRQRKPLHASRRWLQKTPKQGHEKRAVRCFPSLVIPESTTRTMKRAANPQEVPLATPPNEVGRGGHQLCQLEGNLVVCLDHVL